MYYDIFGNAEIPNFSIFSKQLKGRIFWNVLEYSLWGLRGKGNLQN
jgi:hypothetical protein